ncbi:MAG: acyl--CoA ligase [Actinobacteria bacterium]|nr:acyl--CoA ligase [Actinomycetota bacterium]
MGTTTRDRATPRPTYLGHIDAVLEQADEHPLLLFDDAWTTGAELRGALTATARVLSETSQPGDRVIIRATNHPTTIVAILAALLSGRCATPISPRLFDRTGADLLRHGRVIASGRPAALPGGASIPTWNGPLTVLSGDAALEPHPELAATLMTSGTSGDPKPVPILHATFARGIRALRSSDGPPQRRDDVNVICFPLYHLSGLFPMLLTLATGRRIALLEKFDALRVAELVAQYDISSLGLTPTTIRMLLDADVPRDQLAGLRYVRSGTAPLPVRLAQQFQERYRVPVIQSYGQTEAGGEVIGWSPADMRDHLSAKTGAAGRPRPGIEAVVVGEGADPDDGGLPPGEPGELWLRGVQGSDGWLATGDLARIDADGFVWIEGRVDDLILCGGFKIAPALLEETLESHAAVARAAVTAVPDERLGEIPVAVVQLDEDVADAEFEAWCRDRLEPYECPRRFIRVDEVPLTDTGKVHRPSVLAIATSA